MEVQARKSSINFGRRYIDDYTLVSAVGSLVTVQQLSTSDFFSNQLLWNITDNWNVTNLDFANGYFPTLR